MEEDEEELFHLSIRIKDVYDLAADIALEFEKVADVWDTDSVHLLVNKIIIILEHLEEVVVKSHSMIDYITDLRQQIRELKIKKFTNEENKLKFEQDLADAEESWVVELKLLKENLLHLKIDNEQLRNLLQEQLCHNAKEDIKTDQHLIQELRNIVATLNLRLREKDALLEKHAEDISLMKSVIENQNNVSQMLHNKISESQVEIANLWQEKTNLWEKITAQEESLKAMKLQLDHSIVHNVGSEAFGPKQSTLVELDEESIYDESLKYYKEERELLLTRINSLQLELIDSQNEIDSLKKNVDDGVEFSNAASQGESAVRQLFRLFRDSVAKEEQTFRC